MRNFADVAKNLALIALFAALVVAFFFVVPSPERLHLPPLVMQDHSIIEPIPVENLRVDDSPRTASIPYGWGAQATLIPAIHAQAGFRGAGVRIGVVDYGTPTHPALANAMSGMTHYGYGGNPSHSTQVGGIVAEYAPDAKIVFADLTGPYAAAGAIRHCIEQGCSIINCSWIERNPSKQTAEWIRYGISQNVLFVCGAGNDHWAGAPAFPSNLYATMPGVIQAGSYNELGQVSAFSSGGEAVQCTFPGEGIRVLIHPNGTGWGNGTSLATPGVTGTYAVGMGKRIALGKTPLSAVAGYWLLGPSLSYKRLAWPAAIASSYQWN